MHLFPISTVDLVTLLVTLSLDMKDVKQEQKIQTGILRCLENGSESNKTEDPASTGFPNLLPGNRLAKLSLPTNLLPLCNYLATAIKLPTHCQTSTFF